ncbi:MAG: hypothetical protein JXB48_09820 [Candidatus Latescibacteria bacterium]|nr:hypothetical protein [Candidatus Latescibacterota bacterium]
MAEGIMKDLVLDEFNSNHNVVSIEITSAGTHAFFGNTASENAVKVLESKGINLLFHRSKPISDNLVRKADLILTMEKSHTEYIKSIWPFFDSVQELKRYGLKESEIPISTEIMDPIGMGLEIYMEVFTELQREIKRIAPLVFSLAGKKSGN